MRARAEAPTTVFSAVFPLRPVRRDLFPWMDRFECLVEEISGSEFHSPGGWGHPIVWSISEFVPDAEIEEALVTESFWGTLPTERAFRIDFSVKTPTLAQLKKKISANYDMPNEEYFPSWSAFMAEQIKDEISIIMMAMDLCEPDSAYRGGYLLTQQGKWRWKTSTDANFEDAYELADRLDLPKTDKVEFRRAWEYLKAIPGIRDGIGSTPAAKLAVALTYLYAVPSH